MPVSSVEQSIYLKDATNRTPTTQLGKDDFLKLLMMQMKYQDPLSPMDNTEQIAQMAQFSTLEQITNLTQSFAKTQALSMIGKTVTAYVVDELGNAMEITGVVEKVNVVGGQVFLTVNDMYFNADAVCEISDGVQSSGDAAGESDKTDGAQSDTDKISGGNGDNAGAD